MVTVNLRPALDPTSQAAVRELAEDVAQFDGIAGLSEQPLTQLGNPKYKHAIVWKTHKLAAYAHITPGTTSSAEGKPSHPTTVELIVNPDYRQETIAETVIDTIDKQYPSAQYWAYGNLPAAQALAHKLGAQPARTLLQLRARIADLTLADPSSDVTIRTYQGEADHAGLIAVNNRAFDWHPEQGNWTEEDLTHRLHAPWYDPQGLFIAEKDGNIVGFHWTKIDSTTPHSPGEIYILAVHPDYAGQHIGSALTHAGITYFAQRGLDESQLWVEADNSPALHLYHKVGYTTFATHVAYSK